MGPPPYPLEYILRDATGPDGRYTATSARSGRSSSTIRSSPAGPLRTRILTGEKIVEVLEDGLRRYGW